VDDDEDEVRGDGHPQQYDIPCGPILSMKELAEEPSLRKTGTVVEVDHPKRGKYLTVGNPIKLSDSVTEVTRSPLWVSTPTKC
jgi:formyl-CoA transferase